MPGVVELTQPAIAEVRACGALIQQLDIGFDENGVATWLTLELDERAEIEHACALRASRLVIGTKTSPGCATVNCFGENGNTRSDWPCVVILGTCSERGARDTRLPRGVFSAAG